ncbi:hypothetical protein V6N11_026268 [Hibiscus sabdariffa]|uniref:Uncharacterized protein n=1 Tax=Hibiscus sabdariffa TaxID=183260 RepID=A0ABR2SV65_9ROSI
MVPQISEDSSKQPRVLGVGSGLTSGVADGRPPDQGVLIPVQTRLEREALPFSEEDQQVVKRSKGEGNEVMDVGDDVVFGSSQGTGLKVADAGMLNGEEVVGAQGHGGQGKPSRVDDSSQQDEQGKDGSAESYGPWMLATNRKVKRGSRIMTSADRGVDSSKSVMIGACKFDVLANTDDTGAGDDDIIEVPGQDVAARNSGSSPVCAVEGTRVVSTLVENKLPMVGGERTEGDNRVMLHGSGSSKKVSNVSETAGIGAGEVISAGTIVPVRVSLDPKAHTAVCVVESGKEVPVHSIARRRASSRVGLNSMRLSPRVPVGKGGERKGDPGRKKATSRSNSKVPLGGWIEGLSAELSIDGGEHIGLAVVGDKVEGVADSPVQWRKNSSFLSKSDL